MTQQQSSNFTLHSVLTAAAHAGAHFIHISCGSPPSFRVYQDLHFVDDVGVVDITTIQGILNDILTPEEIERFEKNRQVSVSKRLSREHRYRVHVFYQKGFPSLSFHVFPARIERFTNLGLPEFLNRALDIRQGLIIISGLYGSGKTSFIFSILEEWNASTHKRILTIGKPNEITLESKESLIEQVEVGTDIASFAEALDQARDEDYDIIYISEFQEKGLMARILNVVASGKCVLLETNMSTTLETLRILVDCSQKDGVPQAEAALADAIAMMFNVRLLPHISGGFVYATEVLLALPEFRNLLRAGRMDQVQQLIDTSRQEGMISLDQSIARLITANSVSFDDALLYARDPGKLRKMIGDL